MSSEPTPQALAAHVLRRTGFAVDPGQVDRASGMTPEELIDERLNDSGVQAPDIGSVEGWEDYERIVGWILERMRAPEAGLHERMTWFWHDHFATHVDAAGVEMMYEQHRKLRRHALGNFRELVHAVVTDPAMMRYLDADGSDGANPNENLARELMELFTLGRGNYEEADVRAGARALAGWWVDDDGTTWLDDERRYRGRVTFLTRSGNLDVADVADAVCDHPACAPFIAAKLVRFFHGVADGPLEERTAQTLANTDLDIRAGVETVLRDEAFLERRLNRVRQPIEWISAAIVATSFDDDLGPWTFDQLGQVPWSPPNVAGWPSGERWAGADQMLRRADLASWLGSVEVELDPADPVTDVLHRCALHEVSDRTRSTLDRVAERTSSATWEQTSLLFTLALISPEFHLA